MRSCKKCPHLYSCAEDHQIDLYCNHTFDNWILPEDEWDTIGEFLKLKRYKTCTEEYREVMDKQYPNT